MGQKAYNGETITSSSMALVVNSRCCITDSLRTELPPEARVKQMQVSGYSGAYPYQLHAHLTLLQVWGHARAELQIVPHFWGCPPHRVYSEAHGATMDVLHTFVEK